MTFIRARVALAGAVLAGLLLAGLAYNLVNTQSEGRRTLEREFAHRSNLAANLTATLITTATTQLAPSAPFQGPDRELQSAVEALAASQPESEVFVLGPHGGVLAATPRWLRHRSLLAQRRELRPALAGFPVVTDLRVPDSASPTLQIAVPMSSPYGRRVLVNVFGAGLIGSFVTGFLTEATGVTGGRAFLVDSHQRVLGSSESLRVGAPLPSPALVRALATRSSGPVGSDYMATSDVQGTPWKVVFVAPSSALLLPVQSTRGAAWALFAACALALLALVAVALVALRRSAQLVGAQERERAAENLAHERLHDALTGLPNRALFLDRLEHALAISGRRPHAVAVLFLDIDQFKRVNDSLGHVAGDELLTAIARRLRAAIRPADTLSRFGGDEFLVLCDELHDVDDAIRVAARAQEALVAPFVVGPREVRLSCSMGVAVHGAYEPRIEPATLVRDADIAMYRAKEREPGSVELFDAQLHAEALERLDAEVALRGAVAGGELRLHYQPIVSLPSGDITGAEALVRWERPGHGLVQPDGFIGLAEESGLISGIGQWVLERAMSDTAEWAAEGLIADDFVISVNLSPAQLVGDEIELSAGRLLARWPLPASALCLEVTESAVAQNPIVAGAILERLSARGIRLAIDDFGVGRSSLEHLGGALDIDILKLDRKFVGDMDRPRERAIVTAVASLAQDLGMISVAEGVETAEHAAEVAALGYGRGQGYYYARPAAEPEFRARLAGHPVSVNRS